MAWAICNPTVPRRHESEQQTSGTLLFLGHWFRQNTRGRSRRGDSLRKTCNALIMKIRIARSFSTRTIFLRLSWSALPGIWQQMGNFAPA